MSDTKPASPAASTSVFKKATKSQAKAKVALTGPSGSGKTLSALMLAKGLTGNGRVAVIDSENASASLYEDRFPGWEYFVLAINPPYTVQKYLKAIEIAIAEGFDALVIDSLTHAWASEGGLLQQKEALDSRGGNSYTNWGAITKLYEQLKSKLLHSNIHIIVTLRSKQEYILEQTNSGKQAPKKVGLAPIMRDGMEYEFTVVFDIGMDHQFMVSKDRTDLFDGVVATIDEGTGIQLKNWLASPPPTPPPESKKDQQAQSHPPETFDKVPEPEKESQERARPAPKPGAKAKPKSEAPKIDDVISTIMGLCMDHNVKESTLQFLVTQGYQTTLEHLSFSEATQIAAFLDNEDMNDACVQKKTQNMILKRSEPVPLSGAK
jgi:hypothetical protein